MQMVDIVTVKHTEDRGYEVVVWCTTNELSVYRDFLQYILDSCNNPTTFLVVSKETHKVYNAYHLATRIYRMRRRTFEERMDNIQTGNFKF